MKRSLKDYIPKFMKPFLKNAIATLKVGSGLPLKRKQKKLKFEIHLVEHCNLNCAACDNFSPIAEPEFVDVEEFRRDFERMGKLFNHECNKLYLLGGEPLLHPEINELIRIARKNFISGEIDVYTNGLLLAQQPEEFWQTMRNNNIGLYVTCYPVNLDHDKIKAIAEKFGINIYWFREWDDANNFSFGIRPKLLSKRMNYKKIFLSAINRIFV